MTEYNYAVDEDKDFPRITNTHLQQLALCSNELVSDNIQSSTKIVNDEYIRSRLSVASRDSNIIMRAFRCAKIIRFIRSLVSLKGKVILDLDGTAQERIFPVETQ